MIEEFDTYREQLTDELIRDSRLIPAKDGGYKLRTTMQYVLSHYSCEAILDMCLTKSLDELKYCITHKENPYRHTCPICKRQCQFINGTYAGSCRSKRCLCEMLLSNESISDKHQFIIDNYLNGNSEFNYIQIGFIEKYKVYSNSQLPGWHQSVVSTYSNKTPEERKQTRLKTMQTCREKYNTDFSQQAESVKVKQRLTWKNKTSEELELKDKRRKQTTLSKYGVDHIMKSADVIDTVKKRHFEKFSYYHWEQKHISHKDIYFDDAKFKDFVISLYNENNESRVKKTVLDKYFNVNTLGRCEELHLRKYIYVQRSKLEEQVKKAFDNNKIHYQWRNRSIVPGTNGMKHFYELDFYLPDYNAAIEINDLATHNAIARSSSKFGEKYHLYKTEECKKKGIRLIHIWEWDLAGSHNKTINWLLNELNESKRRIGARQCKIKQVSRDEEKDFLNTYHLQGYTKSSVCLGLYNDDELLEVMSFGKARYNKKYEYELLRLCTRHGYSVIGGASRLFKHFTDNYTPESVISYCDYSKFTGDVYEKIGMTFDKLSKPTIVYCDFKMNVINESMLMRYGVDNLLHTNYGPGTDNREMIIKHGYLPVYNCGNLIYVWKK